jgi:hypothetical protein
MKSKTSSYVTKYWYARGYHDSFLSDIPEVPLSEVNDYYLEICNIDIVKEYMNGFEQGKRDRINGII